MSKIPPSRYAIVAALRGIALLALVASIAALLLPSLSSGRWTEAEAAPPGQLTRRAISGIVAASDGSSITISTRFGNVVVNITASTVVHAPPDRNIGVDAIVEGAKVAVFLNRSPVEKPPKEPEPEDQAQATSTPETLPSTEEQPQATSTPETLPSTEEQPQATSTPETLPSTEGQPQATSTPETLPSTEEQPQATSTPVTLPSTEEQPQATSTPETLPSTEEQPQATSTPETLPSTEEAKPAVEPTFVLREVTATVITVIPSKATRSHRRAIVESKAGGKTRLIGKDGELVELDDTSGDTLENGDDIILIGRKKNRFTDEIEIRKVELATIIDDRLEKLKAKFEEAGKTDLLERLAKREKVHKDVESKRIDDILTKAAPDLKGNIDRAKEKRLQRLEGTLPKDLKGRAAGKTDDATGGNPDDSGGGPPSDKGGGTSSVKGGWTSSDKGCWTSSDKGGGTSSSKAGGKTSDTGGGTSSSKAAGKTSDTGGGTSSAKGGGSAGGKGGGSSGSKGGGKMDDDY